MEDEMNLMFGREVRYRTKGGVWKEDGMFHKWVVLGDRVYGIVEQPDGTVVIVRHIDIQFKLKKKMTKNELVAKINALNAARRARLHTGGYCDDKGYTDLNEEKGET